MMTAIVSRRACTRNAANSTLPAWCEPPSAVLTEDGRERFFHRDLRHLDDRKLRVEAARACFAVAQVEDPVWRRWWGQRDDKVREELRRRRRRQRPWRWWT